MVRRITRACTLVIQNTCKTKPLAYLLSIYFRPFSPSFIAKHLAQNSIPPLISKSSNMFSYDMTQHQPYQALCCSAPSKTADIKHHARQAIYIWQTRDSKSEWRASNITCMAFSARLRKTNARSWSDDRHASEQSKVSAASPLVAEPAQLG